MLHPRFRAADLVHYHIIHDGYFSLAALPSLSRAKPTVWTFHDPWAMTGHCIYPLDCTRWQSGCGSCPDLNIPLPLREDRTHFNWRYKKRVYARVDADVIVASQWMKDFASRSPLTRRFRFHVVPFGLDLNRFAPAPEHPVRERLGIFPGHTVIALRADNGPFKGLEHFKDALRQLNTDRPVCILTTQLEGVLDEFIGRYQIVELGWLNDDDLMAQFHQAADFFVMPSVAEAFGLMAVEAMACGKPVICFEGTSLPEVTFAPSVGLAVAMGDPAALAAAISGWVRDPDETRARGALARQSAINHYGLDRQVDRLVAVYNEVLSRHEETYLG
jgi:glycosyltransferase involved in cell wall biosynthesis